MSFLKSAINQVGRDIGKVVSNHIFKSDHSISYRSIGQSNTRISSMSKKSNVKSEFDKAIDFQTGHRPSTLIAKTSGIYTVIKNEAKNYVSDGYLDIAESTILFEMMNRFNMKIDDVCDILEIDEQANEKEINQLTTIVEKTNSLFKEILEISVIGCKERQIEHENEAKNIELPKFTKYVGKHIIWMGKYARGEEKEILKTVLANITDLITLTFPFTRIYLLFKGVFSFPKENKRLKILKGAHIRLAELEGERAESYLNII